MGFEPTLTVCETDLKSDALDRSANPTDLEDLKNYETLPQILKKSPPKKLKILKKSKK